MNRVKIISELGWNHMGDMELAHKMIKASKEAGADIAKFQTWSVKNLKAGPWDQDGRRQIYEQAELTKEKHQQLKKMCESEGIQFMTSVFNASDVEYLSELMNEVKIPSTEMDNWDLIDQIIKYFGSKSDHHVYISTGTSLFQDVKKVVEKMQTAKMNFTLFHCISSYPCPYNICNLDRINDLKKLHENVGYSGHCQGVFDALVSLEYDIKAIEKHVTIDHDLPGRDNKFAILPDELKYLCDYRDSRNELKNYHGENFLESEKDCRSNYKRRWG